MTAQSTRRLLPVEVRKVGAGEAAVGAGSVGGLPEVGRKLECLPVVDDRRFGSPFA
jgi:hypothetical protein